MKNIYSILFACSLLAISSCSFLTSEDESVITQLQPKEEREIKETTISGVVREKELAVGSVGTHVLEEKDDRKTNLQSRTINLNQYIDKKVQISGTHERTEARMPSVFEVNSVKVLGDADPKGDDEEGTDELGDIPKSGIPCAGEDNVLCPDGYICEVDGSEEGAEGMCVSLKAIEEHRKKREELEEKKRQEAEEEKEDDQDENEIDDDEIEKIEDEPDKIEDEIDKKKNEKKIDSDTSSDLSREEEKISDHLREELSTLIGHDGSLSIDTIEFIGSDLVAVEYSDSDNEKGKVVFRYDDNLNFEEKTRYKEGETTTWELSSGDHIIGSGDRRVVKDGNVVSVPEGYTLLQINSRSFQTQYPRRWYYSSIGSTDEAVYRLGFSNQPVESGNEIVTIEIIKGNLEELQMSDGQEVKNGDQYMIYVERGDTTTFRVVGKAEEVEAIRAMAGNLENTN